MKHFLFILSFLMPLFIFINGLMFVVYLCYLSYINPLPINIAGSICLSVTFVLCFSLFIIDYKETKKREILERHYN